METYYEDCTGKTLGLKLIFVSFHLPNYLMKTTANQLAYNVHNVKFQWRQYFFSKQLSSIGIGFDLHAWPVINLIFMQ